MRCVVFRLALGVLITTRAKTSASKHRFGIRSRGRLVAMPTEKSTAGAPASAPASATPRSVGFKTAKKSSSRRASKERAAAPAAETPKPKSTAAKSSFAPPSSSSTAIVAVPSFGTLTGNAPSRTTEWAKTPRSLKRWFPQWKQSSIGPVQARGETRSEAHLTRVLIDREKLVQRYSQTAEPRESPVGTPRGVITPRSPLSSTTGSATPRRKTTWWTPGTPRADTSRAMVVL